MISETDQMDYQLSTKTQSLQSISVGTNESEALHAKLIKKESVFPLSLFRTRNNLAFECFDFPC